MAMRVDRPSDTPSPRAPLVLGGLFAGSAALIAWLVIHAPDIRAAQQALIDAEIAAEDQESCARLGRGPDRDAALFQACRRELGLIRLKQEQRAQAMPFL